jgi:hypothetical protein
MPILIKPFLYIFAFGQAVVLFASVIGLAYWLLIICVRAIVRRIHRLRQGQSGQDQHGVAPA